MAGCGLAAGQGATCGRRGRGRRAHRLDRDGLQHGDLWPSARAIHSHRAMETRPKSIHTVMMSRLIWGAMRLWPRNCPWAAALMSKMIRASPMISPTAVAAAPAYMSLTAVSTGTGAGGRSGEAGWPLDG